jgi:hypothetical protein
MFEGYYSPPLLNDLYNFRDGAQNDIFDGDYNKTTPTPSSNLAASPSNHGTHTPPCESIPPTQSPSHASASGCSSHAHSGAATPTAGGHHGHQSGQYAAKNSQ